MPNNQKKQTLSRQQFLIAIGTALGLGTGAVMLQRYIDAPLGDSSLAHLDGIGPEIYQARRTVDTGGYALITDNLDDWGPHASLEDIRNAFLKSEAQTKTRIERALSDTSLSSGNQVQLGMTYASFLNYVGDPQKAYEALEKERKRIEGNSDEAKQYLYTLIYFQGVAALRRGENENCVMCLGQGACILPIAPTAFHTKREGSQLAIRHFTEYLGAFPSDLEVRWLLNLAHMTLGEHPHKVDPKFLVSLDAFYKSECDIGKFRDVAHVLGINKRNEAGGAIMEDFDNDGLLDLVVTSWDAREPIAYYHNNGDGTFENRAEAAGISNQLGGLYCVQGDYNNDGNMDIFITRGAWLKRPMRPTLLRNNGDGTFTDVTKEAGLIDSVTSNSALWADYDNDGLLDLFICCEAQPNKLYHNNGDGTFTEVADKAGVAGYGGFYKGATWIDYDNDGFPDLFLNNLSGRAELYHNNGDGTFTDVTFEMHIDGPQMGFSCWAWDYDNDGWLDIFATSYDRTVGDVVNGLLGHPHGRDTCRLFRNMQGKDFQDVSKEVGLDRVYGTMGSNFGDFDNDGYLDMYLGTGDPSFTTLIPNRMFKNVDGKRFVEITASAGVGNLQKGHAVACGDWDNDGNTDIFIQMGGAVLGDKFQNILFQNPGQGNNSLTVKLVGVKTNRAAIGARITAITSGDSPLTVHRHVTSGSSFGANTLQQTLGLGKADHVASLEIYWPTSKTKQTFHNIPANQAIEITEFQTEYRVRERKRIVLPA